MVHEIVVTRPIPGHEKYHADVFGNIWSTQRGRWGKTYAPFHRLRTHADRDGYLCAQLWNVEEKRARNLHVHVLIAATFLGPRPAGHHVCHVNGVKTDNAIWNLMYGTPAENIRQAVAHGTHVRGERCHKARITADQVNEIRRRRQAGEPLKVLAQEFGIGVSSISAAATSRSWRHLTAPPVTA